MAPPKQNVIDRFFKHVDKQYPCWLWTGRKDKDGYGEFQLEGKKVGAHRAAFSLLIGALLPNEIVRHACDNPSCVKPAHLLVGKHQDNKNDSVARNRHAKEITHGLTKLTQEKVKAIYDDPRTQKEIALDFSVGQSHVSRIKRKESWARLLQKHADTAYNDQYTL